MKHLLAGLSMTLFSVGFAQTTIPGFTLTDVTSGAAVSLDGFVSRPAVVVIFTSNVCPFDQAYAERIGSLVANYSDRVPILLVNAHLDAAESEDEMKRAAAGWKFRAPYLSDKNQSAMDVLGAKRSPEAFLLVPGKSGFTIAYGGAIDDSPQTPGTVGTTYLRNAIENALAGKPGPPPVRAAGCSIRRK
jgi:hypothetical protein